MHAVNRVLANLVAEAAAAGVDHNRDLARRSDAKGGGRSGVVNLIHSLDFEEVVPRAERAELRADPA